MRWVLVVVVCVILVACSNATVQKYDVLLDKWLDKPELELVTAWGAPDYVYELEGKKFIAYYSQYNQYVRGSFYNYQLFFVVDGWPYFDPVEDVSYQVVAMPCKTTFTIVAQRINAWSHQGSGCVAK